MQKFIGAVMVLSGLALPAFAQTTATTMLPLSTSSNAAQISQLQTQITSLKAQQASLQTGSSEKVQLLDQINALQTREAQLKTSSQRAEKNTHMLKEMGVNG